MLIGVAFCSATLGGKAEEIYGHVRRKVPEDVAGESVWLTLVVAANWNQSTGLRRKFVLQLSRPGMTVISSIIAVAIALSVDLPLSRLLYSPTVVMVNRGSASSCSLAYVWSCR